MGVSQRGTRPTQIIPKGLGGFQRERERERKKRKKEREMEVESTQRLQAQVGASKRSRYGPTSFEGLVA